MSRTFNGSTQYAEVLTGIVTAMPVTMACWFNVDNVTARHTLMSLGQGTNLNDIFSLDVRGDVANDPLRILQACQSPLAASASSIDGVTASTWHHACGVLLSTTSRTVYFNGTAGTTDTTSISAPSVTINRFAFGVQELSVKANFAAGLMAEGGVWSVALDAAEIAALAKGVSSLLIRRASLVGYWPLIGRNSPEIPGKGEAALTLTGSPSAAAGPRIYLAT